MREILKQVPWKAVTGILLAGLLVSGCILLFPGTDRELAQETAGDTAVYTVSFLNDRGELLEEQQVPAGSFAVPPQMDMNNDSIAFRGWSQKLYDIRSSTEMTPIYQDLRQERNVFYMDSRCAQLGEEVEADLWIGGNVCLSSIRLVLEYDPTVLLELECDVSESPFQVIDEDAGCVVLELDTDQNLTGPCTAVRIRFRIAPDRTDIAKTRLRIGMEDPARITDGGEMGTDSRAVHCDIYLLS